MPKFRLTIPAEMDLFELWAFIANDNLAAADRMVERLNGTFARVAKYPGLGEVHGHPTRALRRVAVSPYVVIYEHKADEVTIMRVLHAARRWEDLL